MNRSELLSFEELVRVARLFIGAGVEKIRLTGGEPLIRRDIHELVAKLAQLPGLADLTLTTNASLLTPGRARSLRESGLSRLTVSLDALDDATFHAVNDVGFPVSRVLEGIDNAAAAGLHPIKINMVVKRGVNDHALVPMANHFRGTGHILRFIEFMDVGSTNGWRLDDVVSSSEIVARIDEAFGLEPLDPQYRGEVARRWRYRDGAGEIGVISSVSAPFCGNCTRARLSAEGKVYTCLFATSGVDLRRLLREGASDEYVSGVVGALWTRREDRYSELRTSAGVAAPKIEMSYIGG